MRKHLYKAKRLDNGEWVEGDLSCDKYILPWNGEFYARTAYYDGMNWCECSAYEIDPATVCQFTGLTDKNGRDIFEGDIVRNGYTNHLGEFYNNGTVVYVENDGCFEIANDECYLNRLTRNMVVQRNIEVIRSIHDTPNRGPHDV